MKKTIVLALAVVIAAFSLALLLIGDENSSTGVNASYAQSDAADAPAFESLMRRGELSLEEGNWQRADEFFERVLDINPEHAPAYIGKLLAELKIKNEADLVNHIKQLDNMLNYKRALRFADERYKAKVTGYNQTILSRPARVGDIIQFGGYEWRVLDVQDKRALIITENIIEPRPYNDKREDVTWETCTLRKYLNDEFYAKFSKEEQGRIAETKISNPDNLWYDTKGGADTNDKIFLLSLEEVAKYFGNSDDYLNKKRSKYEGQYPSGKWVPANDGYGFSNTNDNGGIVKLYEITSFWWLRSPGINSMCAAVVDYVDGVDVSGSGAMGNDYIGFRPVLWLNP